MRHDRALRRVAKRREKAAIAGAKSCAGPTFPEKVFLEMQNVAGSFLTEEDVDKKAILRGTLNGMATLLHAYYSFFGTPKKVQTIGYWEKKAVQLATRKVQRDGAASGGSMDGQRGSQDRGRNELDSKGEGR